MNSTLRQPAASVRAGAQRNSTKRQLTSTRAVPRLCPPGVSECGEL